MTHNPFNDRLIELFTQRFNTIREAKAAANVQGNRFSWTHTDSRPHFTYHTARIFCCGDHYVWMPEKESDRESLKSLLSDMLLDGNPIDPHVMYAHVLQYPEAEEPMFQVWTVDTESQALLIEHGDKVISLPIESVEYQQNRLVVNLREYASSRIVNVNQLATVDGVPIFAIVVGLIRSANITDISDTSYRIDQAETQLQLRGDGESRPSGGRRLSYKIHQRSRSLVNFDPNQLLGNPRFEARIPTGFSEGVRRSLAPLNSPIIEGVPSAPVLPPEINSYGVGQRTRLELNEFLEFCYGHLELGHFEAVQDGLAHAVAAHIEWHITHVRRMLNLDDREMPRDRHLFAAWLRTSVDEIRVAMGFPVARQSRSPYETYMDAAIAEQFRQTSIYNRPFDLEDLRLPARPSIKSCANCCYLMRGQPSICNAFHTPSDRLTEETNCPDWGNK